MSFLTPLFLLGSLAIIGPILFHLIRRTTNDRVTFSSLLFLQPTPPRLTRRSRIEHWFLLLLRCLVLALLALGFARPFLLDASRATSDGTLARQQVILLDTSASMQREGVWPELKSKAVKLVSEAKPLDQVSVYSFDQQVKPLVSFEQWRQAQDAERRVVAQQRVNDLKPAWKTTQLGQALVSVAEAMEEEIARTESKRAAIEREIVVFTDLAEGAKVEGLQGYQWPTGLKVRFELVGQNKRSNAGVQVVAEADEAAASTAEEVIRVRVANSSDAKKEQFQVGWTADGRTLLGTPVNVHVPAGQSRVVSVPRSAEAVAASQVLLTGDDEPFDNLVSVVGLEPDRIGVLYFGDEAPSDARQMLYYVARGLQSTRSQIMEVTSRSITNFPSAGELAAARFIIVGQKLNESQLAELRRSAEGGKTLLYVLKDADMAASLAPLLSVSAVPVEEAKDARHALLGQLDFTHPLFAPFSDPRFSDFTKVYFWKHRKVDLSGLPKAQVLARFDDETPALFSVKTGKGQVFVLTSGWQPADSQLALSSKFVPLLYSFLEQTGTTMAKRAQYQVGTSITLPTGVGNDAILTRPDGVSGPVEAGKRQVDTELPGIYGVQSGGKQWRFAVNLPPEESRTAKMPVEELERLGVPVHNVLQKSPQQLQARQDKLKHIELENRQKLWRWLVIAALAFVLLETWLAARLTRPTQNLASS